MVQNEQEAKWPGRIADASSTLGDNSCAEHYWVSFELSEPRSVDGDSDRRMGCRLFEVGEVDVDVGRRLSSFGWRLLDVDSAVLGRVVRKS